MERDEWWEAKRKHSCLPTRRRPEMAVLAVVRAVRRRLPDTIALMTDYNQALTVTKAIRRGQAQDGKGLYWIEEPTRHDDYAGCARIAGDVIVKMLVICAFLRRVTA
jgi:L-alanine-DL-glutamate epimerase-like enolase superfamily enzyme